MEDRQYNVTISSEEYRELITSGVKAEAERDRYQSQYWEEQRKVSQIEKSLKETQAMIQTYAAFIASDSDVSQKYAQYVSPKIGE